MLFGKRNGERDSDRVECKKSDYKISTGIIKMTVHQTATPKT